MKNYIAALVEILVFSTILLLPCYLADDYRWIFLTWIPATLTWAHLESARNRDNNQDPFG